MNQQGNKNRLIRMASALLTLMLLSLSLSACQQTVKVPQPATVKHTLTLSVQRGVSQVALESMKLFCEKTSELSVGAVSVTLEECDDALAALDNGADLIFAPNEVVTRANGNFASYTSPFYFFDYKQLTLALNSENFSELTGEVTRSLMDAQTMGAFYDGNSVILSVKEELLDTVDQYKGIKIYISENPTLEYLFNKLEVEDLVIKTPAELINGFNGGKYYIIECDTLKLEEIKMPHKRKVINIFNSFHAARINWLLLSSDTSSELTPREQAVLAEAMAFAIAKNDETVLALENKGFEYLAQIGSDQISPNNGEFSQRTDQVLKNSARYSNLWDWELHTAVRSLANPQ